MYSRNLVLLQVLVALVLTGCASAQSEIPQRAAAFAASEQASGTSLLGTRWELAELNGKSPNVHQRVVLRLLESGSELDGFTGCHDVIGQYILKQNALQLDPKLSNEETCDPNLIRQEQAFLRALRGTKSYRIRGDVLELLAQNRVLARFHPARVYKVAARPPIEARPPSPVSMFPWPPPAASARQVIPNGMLWHGPSPGRFGDLDSILIRGLEQNGYFEKSYFGVPPGGFVLVTRLEHIEPDGSPMKVPARWAAGSAVSVSHFSLSDYVRALFTADPGYYRIIAFVVTDTPFSESDKTPTESEASAWLRDGMNVLPASIAQVEFTTGMSCTVLIYEFERPSDGSTTTKFLLESHLDAHTHLVKSGLWAALGGD